MKMYEEVDVRIYPCFLDLDASWSGQLHTPAALPPGEEPPVPIGWEAGWTSGPVWTWRRKKFLTLPTFELRPLGRRSRSQSLNRLRYPGSYTREERAEIYFHLPSAQRHCE
jgi:hypothetical protein